MEYNFKEIEKKWQDKWYKEDTYEPDLDNPRNHFYNLMMFPYPSAEGLHVGNMYAFTGSDIYGRYKRMQGKDVFEPIGLDGFGIHSENYALKINNHPMDLSKKSEEHFYNQLKIIGNGFAWKERLETYKPEYYKWTQWVFKKMFDHGLAYRKKSPVNWCPSCKTVLADEQVISGKCERCGGEVERKEFSQWFFKITKYADRLLDDLEKIDWSEIIKTAQRNWIGRSYGSMIDFGIKGEEEKIKVFTTRADTLFGATYVVLSPEHKLVEKLKEKAENKEEIEKYTEEAKNKTEQERIAEKKGKTGVEIKNVYAVNPVNNKEIPIYIADYVLSGYGTGAIMAVPAHDERDYDFAKKYNIPIIEVIKPLSPDKVLEDELYEGEGVLVNSEEFNDVKSEEARGKITEKVRGETHTNYHLRDWLISRQRYWGAPIPLVYCEKCAEKIKNGGFEGELSEGEKENPGWFAVPEKELPVELPYIEDFRPTGTEESPLATVESFYKTKCPKCGGEAVRETDVSDTFLDSSWYYFRYISPNKKEAALNDDRVKKWLPVNMYIGGAEHSVLHLLYTRFVTKAFYDWGLINFDEPFTCFRAHGLLIKEGAKMSKSKGNVVNPDEYISKYGADSLRMYLMFLAPFEEGGDFRDSGIKGIVRFLNRTWVFCNNLENKTPKELDKNIDTILHQTIKNASEDIENLKYNTAISKLMVLLNEFEKNKNLVKKEEVEIFLKLLAPFAPHVTEELWHKLGNESSIHKEKWPDFDPEKIKEESFDLIIQVNGKLKDTAKTKKDITKEGAEEIALKSEKVKNHVNREKVKKVIFVENKLINFVI
jgi:leucyl-tRNA synthetase